LTTREALTAATVYVFHLPARPVWVLHTFYLVTTALMLVWYLRYQLPRRTAFTKLPRSGEDAAPTAGPS
jgi:hypothetical protein